MVEEGMVLEDYLYVHLDGISNSILSKGLTHHDFHRYTLERPENLLLLDPYVSEGEYENHSGFRVIRGEENIDHYFDSLVSNPKQRGIKWLDFKEYDVLKQMTPNEIAELLYFGHMKSQLRSPFFYKLQNNYAFFDMGNHLTKIYYRYIEEFYQTLSQKLTQKVINQLNANRSFFSKKLTHISVLPVELVSQLKPSMQEGIVFNFSQVGLIDGQYIIPIHVIEDNLRKIENGDFKKAETIGRLVYDEKSASWELYKEEFDSLFI